MFDCFFDWDGLYVAVTVKLICPEATTFVASASARALLGSTLRNTSEAVDVNLLPMRSPWAHEWQPSATRS